VVDQLLQRPERRPPRDEEAALVLETIIFKLFSNYF
jgi:hypothetical protein